MFSDNEETILELYMIFDFHILKQKYVCISSQHARGEGEEGASATEIAVAKI
jgi:hypothetical protein